MRTEFNPNRFIPLGFHGEQQQIHVSTLHPLVTTLEQNQLAPSTPVLYTNRDGKVLVFQTRHFSLYNVMQSGDEVAPWMATFCAICNAGMSFSPVIDGVRYDFYGAGFYDAMTLLADTQTGSYWDHITGECIAGKMKGARLQHLATMTHAKADVVAQIYPEAQVVLSSLDAGRAGLDNLAEDLRTQPQPNWLPELNNSLDPDLEDKRLPRLEMGLGVWTGKTRRFYPFKTIHALDNLLFDDADGEQLLVYIDPETFNPSALFTDATSGTWRGESIMLNNGQVVQNSALYEQGDLRPMRRPLQLFQRWYGFSITFPGCDIYTAKKLVTSINGEYAL
jgi:hypothetical protein